MIPSTTQPASRLREILSRYPSALIGFSGGGDSTFLARTAADVIGPEHVLLVTATSATYPSFELEESKQLAATLGLQQLLFASAEIESSSFSDNPPDRCYHCKYALFTRIRQIASEKGIAVVFDGSNADDDQDFRPGHRALRELGMVSPLRDAGRTKEMIRSLSRELHLPTADKPSYACLASRFPYGEKITREKLQRVAQAEQALRERGLTQLRVRSHGDLARIELPPLDMERGWQMRNHIENICREAGFVFVAIDLRGYRMGAMNETLAAAQRS